MARRTPACVRSQAKKYGVSESILLASWKRGIGAHKTNRASVRNLQGKKYAGGTKMSAMRWACARSGKLARLKTKAGYDQDLLRRRRK